MRTNEHQLHTSRALFKMKSKSKGAPKKSYAVPARYKEKVRIGFAAYLKKNDFKLEDESRAQTGSKKLTGNTTKNYGKHFNGLFRFSCVIGDYESLLILHPQAPLQFCPSMKARTVALYMRYKTMEKGSPLLDENDRHVFNVFDERVLCVGDWKDPGNCDQYMSSVTRIHMARGQSGLYMDECNDCIQAYNSDKNSTGCRFHPGEFRVWRKGNPRQSELVQNLYSECKDYCSHHVIKGSYQLLPEALMQIRDLLLSTGRLHDLQLWCIILVSIYLFLRHDEFHGIKLSDIRREFSAVTQEKISSICIRVKGKTDNVPRNLVLWSRDEMPSLCPVRTSLDLLSFGQVFVFRFRFVFVSEFEQSFCPAMLYHSFGYDEIEVQGDPDATFISQNRVSFRSLGWW